MSVFYIYLKGPKLITKWVNNKSALIAVDGAIIPTVEKEKKNDRNREVKILFPKVFIQP